MREINYGVCPRCDGDYQVEQGKASCECGSFSINSHIEINKEIINDKNR